MKFNEIYEMIQKTAEKEQNLLNKTYPERIRVVDKNGGLICAMDAESTEWLNKYRAYIWDLEVISGTFDSTLDSDSCSIEDAFQIVVDCESDDDGAIQELKRCSEFVNMSKLLSDLGVSRSNYIHYLKGEGKLSLEKVSKVINALKKIPINSEEQVLSKSTIDQFKIYGKHVNMTKLIKEMGIYVSVYHGYLNGKRNLPEKEIQRILKALKTRPIRPIMQ